MIRNADLFKKMAKVSREIRMSAFRQAGKEMPEQFKGRKCMRRHGMNDNNRPSMDQMRNHGPHRRGMSRERLLVIINEYTDGINQKQLAESAGINASTTSEIVARLEDDGYLVRTIDENDKRATVLKLTEMGKVRAEEVRSEREGFLDEVFSKLTEEEKQTLSDILDKLIAQ